SNTICAQLSTTPTTSADSSTTRSSFNDKLCLRSSFKWKFLVRCREAPDGCEYWQTGPGRQRASMQVPLFRTTTHCRDSHLYFGYACVKCCCYRCSTASAMFQAAACFKMTCAASRESPLSLREREASGACGDLQASGQS